MKIGIDARLINQTGVGRYLKNLISNLDDLDDRNEYVLFARRDDLNDFSKIKAENGKWKIVIADIPWHSFEEQTKFTSLLNKEDLDLVHFPYFSVPITYNRPFVVTIHDLIIHHFATGRASTLPGFLYWPKVAGYKFVILRAAKKAEKIIAVSKSTKDEIVDHLKIDPGKIEVTYEAVDDKVLSESEKPKDLKSKKFFLFVGNVYPHKNTESLIKAFRKIDDPEAGLVFAGKEDHFYKKLKKQTKDMERIEFLGNISDENLSWLYKNSLATICPAFMEGFGLPALEAMANNCLVIASDIPSLREVCEDNAVYFNPKNPDDLVVKMKEVLENKKKFENKIENGYKRSQEFSWRKMSEQTLRIYKSVNNT